MAAPTTARPRPGVAPRRRAVALVTGLSLALVGCGDDDTIRLGSGSSDLAPAAESLAVGVDGLVIDDVEFATFDGGIRNISEFTGRPLVINFFATTCPPCISEMPHLETVFNEVEGEVAFLGLSQDSTAADALDLVAETGVTYDVGWDRDLEVFSLFGSWSMPTTVFVRADGEVAEVFPGALTVDAIREKVEDLRS